MGTIKNEVDYIKDKYDYIIIAVFDYMIAEVIKQELIELGVDSNKMIWKKPLMN